MTRSFLATLLALLGAVGCEALGGPDSPTVQRPDDTAIPDSVRALYREDAGRLALRHLQELQSPTPDQIELPAELVQSLYDALVWVHNSTELAARDSVVTLYRIHTFPRPDVMRLAVAVSHAADWGAAWKRGERLTGNPEVDTLLLRWDLTLGRYYVLSSLDFDLATLLASRPLNLFPLSDLFKPIHGVWDAYPEGWGGDGNDITAKPDADAWVLDYSVGYGDCPAGCLSHRFWTFRVARDGTVQFLGARGSPPPPPGTRP